MKFATVRTCCLAATLVLGLLAFMVPTAARLPAQAQRQGVGMCTTAAESGEWAYTATGTLIKSTGPVQFAVVGRNTWDAKGNIIAGTQTTSGGGVIGQNTPRGTITVDPDCTGTIAVRLLDPTTGALQRTATWAVVFDDNGREMRAIMTSLQLPDGTSVPPIVTMISYKLFPDRETAR